MLSTETCNAPQLLRMGHTGTCVLQVACGQCSMIPVPNAHECKCVLIYSLNKPPACRRQAHVQHSHYEKLFKDRMQTDGQTHGKRKLLFDDIKGCSLVGQIAFDKPVLSGCECDFDLGQIA